MKQSENLSVKILAVDDSPEALYALEQILLEHGYQVVCAGSGAEAWSKLESEAPDVVLSDVHMPGLDGFELTKRIRANPALRHTPVVLLTAKTDLQDVIKGLEEGANDYIRKPFEAAELLARLKAALRDKQLYSELETARSVNRELSGKLSERFSFGSIIGKSAAMQEVFSLIEKIKDADCPVLISGESGTGKELVASALHYNSPRREKRLVAQNCSAFNENLLESELFGHVKGAFTGAIRDKQGLFEAADGGTFFLDELGEMSPALQVKLLRVLQDGTFIPVGATSAKQVSVRIVAATNRDLRQMVARGEFREDLFYRLNVVNVKLPPLRERRVDIPLLAGHFLEEQAKRRLKPLKGLSAEALQALCDYAWPGNIRELQNEIERVCLLSGEAQEIDKKLLSPHIAGGTRDLDAAALAGEPSGKPPSKLKEAMQQLEKQLIAAALNRAGGNKSEAARELGISRSNLIVKVQEYSLE